jgi:putative intracellular protease/amidase
MTGKFLITGAIAIGLVLVGLFTFPGVLRAMGLHPPYRGPRYAMPGGRAVIITTSHARLGSNGPATGVFGSEMTGPYYAFRDGQIDVDLVSIEGGEIPIDPLSFRWYVESQTDRRFRRDTEFRNKVKYSKKIDDVNIAGYDIVFLAGGWGAAYDLGFSNVLGHKITEAWRAKRVVGGICHGPLGLLRAKDDAGESLVKGRSLTAVTDKQIRELGISVTPQHPERELRAAGARFESKSAFRDFFANHTVTDGRLVTGQNQNAAMETAEEMIRIARAIRTDGNAK